MATGKHQKGASGEGGQTALGKDRQWGKVLGGRNGEGVSTGRNKQKRSKEDGWQGVQAFPTAVVEGRHI